MLKILWKHFYSVSVLLLLLSVQITSPSCCWFWVLSLPEHAERKALGGSSQPWLSPCWIHIMDVHYAFTCGHPRLVFPQTNNLTLFAFLETPSCPKVQYFTGKPFSYLPCSLIRHDFCSLLELSSLTSPGFSSFSIRHKKLTLLCIPSKLCHPSLHPLQPPFYDLSMPDLPICPLRDANTGVNLLFFKHPFS